MRFSLLIFLRLSHKAPLFRPAFFAPLHQTPHATQKPGLGKPPQARGGENQHGTRTEQTKTDETTPTDDQPKPTPCANQAASGKIHKARVRIPHRRHGRADRPSGSRRPTRSLSWGDFAEPQPITTEQVGQRARRRPEFFATHRRYSPRPSERDISESQRVWRNSTCPRLLDGEPDGAPPGRKGGISTQDTAGQRSSVAFLPHRANKRRFRPIR